MKKRWTADQIARMLKEADRELAKGLTVPDVCRKIGIAQATYYRWRQRHDPARVDDDRRRRELELEVERLKRLVAELMLDKQMLQDITKKSGDPGSAAGGGRLPGRALRGLAAAGLPGHGPGSLEPEVSPGPPS
jgi:putative transposase